MEQKNWAIVRTVVGYRRYGTEVDLFLLNKIWAAQSKVTKRYNVATTPHRRAEAHKSVTEKVKARLAENYTSINPAAVQRQIQTPTTDLQPGHRQGPNRRETVRSDISAKRAPRD